MSHFSSESSTSPFTTRPLNDEVPEMLEINEEEQEEGNNYWLVKPL